MQNFATPNKIKENIDENIDEEETIENIIQQTLANPEQELSKLPIDDNELSTIYEETDDSSILTDQDAPAFALIVDTHDLDEHMLTDKITVEYHRLYTNVYIIEFRNSNNISALTIVYDTFGDILSSTCNELEFPNISYKDFGNYILMNIANHVKQSMHRKVLGYIVANEIHQKRNPLRLSFLEKYGKRYNNVRSHVVMMKKEFGKLCENQILTVKEKINQSHENVILSFPYNVDNVLSQFMLLNGFLGNKGPITFVMVQVFIPNENDHT